MNTVLDMPGDHPDPVARAFEQFLGEPGVEHELLEARDQVHRAEITEDRAAALRLRATRAEVEAGRLERADDPHGRKRLSFATGAALTLALAAFDSVAAYMAAQAFGQDLPTTLAITVLLVGTLAFAIWAVDHFGEVEQ